MVTITFAQLCARWAILKGIVRLPQGDEFSFTALLQRVVKRFHTYFMILIAFALTDAMLGLPQAVSVIVKIFFVLAAILQIAEWVQEFAVSFIRRNVARSSGDARALASAFNIIKWFISVAVWSVALLLILDNVGADVTALLAGLGIGGIAIGIAIGVAIAASLSLATPLCYQTNLMVYGPGGYRFSDFLRMGPPLQSLLGILSVALIAFFWSL